MDIVIGIILIVAAVFLIIAVLLQSGKDKSLSGTIAGGSAETFYGKTKSNSKEQKLSRLTTVVAIVFVVLVLVSFVIQDDGDIQNLVDQLKAQATATESIAPETSDDVTAGTGTEEGTGTDGSEADGTGTEEISDTEPVATGSEDVSEPEGSEPAGTDN